MPAPSPRMNPSRSRSNGRLARVGSSLRVESAVSRLKPVTPKGWIMLCVPPESITSASPRRRISTASPMACELAAAAVRGPGLLLGLADRVELPQPLAGERLRVHLPLARGAVDQVDEPREVLL